MDNTESLPILSLCSGYAGIELGLKGVLRGCRNVAYVEIETFAVRNLVEKMETGALDPAPVYTNLKTFPFNKFRNKVGLLTGGFPCQPFANCGLRKGSEDPRHLFPYIKDGIVECQPEYVFLENVEGIVSSKLKGDHWADPEGTPVLLHVLRELERIGYEPTWGVFSACEVWAPHRRKRIFILARRPGAPDLPYRDSTRLEGYDGYEHDEIGQGRLRPAGSFDADHFPLWPASPGPQYEWEPPRVSACLRYPDSVRESQQSGGKSECWNRLVDAGEGTYEDVGRGVAGKPEAQSKMGRNPNGGAYRMDYAHMCQSSDNRTDEIRLLGNGVVPASVARAIVVLDRQLHEEY